MMAGSARFTVNDLVGLRDWPLRCEVLDGRLLVAPAASRRHARVVDNLAALIRRALPEPARVRGEQPVRLPDGDGPVPDLVVATAVGPGWLPAAEVHTAIEVVAADGHHVDRVWKRERYAAAGIACYWRVELEPGPVLRGRLPLIVVRVRQRAGWREMVAAAGGWHVLPVAYGPPTGGVAVTVPVRLDPGVLTVRGAATR